MEARLQQQQQQQIQQSHNLIRLGNIKDKEDIFVRFTKINSNSNSGKGYKNYRYFFLIRFFLTWKKKISSRKK